MGVQLIAKFAMSELYSIASAVQGMANPDNLAEPPKVALHNSIPIHTETLWRSKHTGTGTIMHPRPRSFSAQFVVPIDATPSVVLNGSSKSHIKYSVKVELLVASTGQNLRSEIAIAVVRPMPLYNPPLVLPVIPKEFTNFLVEAGIILDRSVYAVGQDMQLQISVVNGDKRPIKGIRVSLEEVRNAHSVPELAGVSVLATETIESMISCGQVTSVTVVLHPGTTTPFIAPSTFTGCVQVEHYIRIQVIPNSLFSMGLVLSVPVEIVGVQRI
ncbi:hypothetical protein BASA81_015485 [Batrachochytrium salamandrivorans]|nr:hypothetical protein BASA81_015485 [Batrachochytrium salamandrivorans]